MRKLLLFTLILGINISLSQHTSPYRIFFTTQSARIDTTAIRPQEAEGDDTPGTYTVGIDLNGDGKSEQFIADAGSCGSGGCPWMIYDGKTNAELGEVDGIIVYILKRKHNGFPLIETYWKLGGSNAVVYYYQFDAGQYKQTSSKDLDEQGMEEYFKSKPAIADEFKELE